MCSFISILVVPQFWKDLKPVKFGEIPQLQEGLGVAGYPIGGSNLSVSTGVVSRYAVKPSQLCNLNILTVQTDAAINVGNSGGLFAFHVS